MMTCQQIETELSAYVDAELPASQRAEVQSHLAGCAHCRQHLAQLQQLSEGVARLPKLEASPRFVPDLFRKIPGGYQPRSSWVDVLFRPMWLKLPVEAVAVLALGVCVMFLVQHGEKTRPRACVQVTLDEPAPAPAEERKDGVALPQPRRSPAPTAMRRMAAAPQPAAAPAAAMTVGSVVLTNANPLEVEQRVVALLTEMRGRLLEVKQERDAPRCIRVCLPTAIVSEFKARLAEGGRALGLAKAEKKAEAEAAMAEEAMTGLEIQVATPAAK
jgi:anti-sigma factor RsiW